MLRTATSTTPTAMVAQAAMRTDVSSKITLIRAGGRPVRPAHPGYLDSPFVAKGELCARGNGGLCLVEDQSCSLYLILRLCLRQRIVYPGRDRHDRTVTFCHCRAPNDVCKKAYAKAARR
jgi:hypothetical protein